MLKTTPDNLLRLIESAQRAQEERLVGVDDAISRYKGPDRAGTQNINDAPENVEFEYISYMMPSQVFDRPRVSAESTLLSKQDDAMAIQVGMNRWIRDTKFREPCLQACLDTQFAWACMVTSNVPSPELGEVYFEGRGGSAGRRGVAYRPYTKRIPFRDAFRDPQSTSPYDMRFAGHVMRADKDDLIQNAEDNPEDGWNLEELRGIATDTDLQKFSNAPKRSDPTRDEVTYYQIWVADAHIDWDAEKNPPPKNERKLYHGKLFYIATAMTTDGGREQKWIRNPQPFYGPRYGPYEFIGTHIVPDDPFFMATTQPMRSTIKVYNDLVSVANRADKNYKRIIIVNDLTDDLATLVRDSKHDHVFAVPGYERGTADSMELGGSTQQMDRGIARLKDRVDRGLGMSDAQRGAATGGASATENAIAAESSSARMGYAKKQFTEGVQRVLTTVAWYLWHDDEVSFPISLEEFLATGGNPQDLMGMGADGQVQVTQPRYFGGTDDKEKDGDSFDGLELEIQPFSMERMSEAKAGQNALTITNMVASIGPLVPQLPWVRWDYVMRKLAKDTGIPELTKIFDLEVAGEMAQSEALAKYSAGLEGDGPRMSGDSGAAKAPTQGAAPNGQPLASMTQAPQTQIQKPESGGLQGRTTGGNQGNKAAQSVGVA